MAQMGQGSGLEYVPNMYKVLNSIPSREWSVYRYGFSISYLNPNKQYGSSLDNSQGHCLDNSSETIFIISHHSCSLFQQVRATNTTPTTASHPPKPYTLILSFSSIRNATFLILSLQMDIYLYPLIKLFGCWALNLEPNMY